MKHIREIMDNDCPTCEGRKMILTRDYADCEREETCPTCAEPTITIQFMIRCDAPGCREYLHRTGPYAFRGGWEDETFRLGWTKVRSRFPTTMADDFCPTCTKKRMENDAERD